jgi:CO/xanthine dehydrogenase FAD-binding subunit
VTFRYEKPASLAEAMALGSMHKEFYVLAGGTDLLVQWRSGLIDLPGVIDISSIDDLKGIADAKDGIEIGALATHSQIATSEAVLNHIPVLAEACRTIGAVQIQNRGTIGGNIMNASPAGDTLPVLLALGARLQTQDLKKSRWIALGDFFTGYRKTALRAGELLTRVKIPKPGSEEMSRFYKVGSRQAQAISKVVMCIRGEVLHGGIKDIVIALGSVAPTVVRAPGTEALLRGQAITLELIEQARRSLVDEVHPIDDIRSTADYRRFVCGNLLARYLQEATSTGGR